MTESVRRETETAAPARRARNRFDRMEWAGAFGDLGTLIPFVVAYISVVKVDPFGVLFSFGAAMVICGSYYKTPFPVQPMKAAGAVAGTQAAQTAVITPAAVYRGFESLPLRHSRRETLARAGVSIWVAQRHGQTALLA
jgi:hypothetical protein